VRAAIAIPHLGGGNQRVQQRANSVDEDVAFLALDQLAGVAAMPGPAYPDYRYSTAMIVQSVDFLWRVLRRSALQCR